MDSPKTDAMRRTRALYSAGGTAALSVIDVDSGGPFTTLVNVAVDSALRPLLLISALAHHSKCLTANPMASVMLHEAIATDTDPMLTFRATLLGRFETVPPEEAAQFFLARHPYAELYAGFGDFAYWRMEAQHAHIIAGFGRAYGVRFSDIAAL